VFVLELVKCNNFIIAEALFVSNSKNILIDKAMKLLLGEYKYIIRPSMSKGWKVERDTDWIREYNKNDPLEITKNVSYREDHFLIREIQELVSNDI